MWDKLADKTTVERTMAALKNSGVTPYYVQSGSEAKKKLFELLPAGAEVMDMTSTTLNAINAVDEIQKSGRYEAVKGRLMAMDMKTQGREMKKMGAAPAWAAGSVHAVTESGQIMVASNTGSQLPAYAYGADQVVWVVGTHKIVKNLDEGFKRLYERCLPLEDARARKVYGVGSAINKVLVIHKEVQAGRLSMILVNEVLGF